MANIALPVTKYSVPSPVVATDEVGGVEYLRVKIDGGGAGAAAPVLGDTAFGLDVDVTRIVALPAGDNNIGNVDLVTVPAPLSTSGGGTEATALRVTIANDSTGLVSIDDGGGSLSVDDGGGSVTVDGTVTANAGSGTFVVGDGGDSLTVDGAVSINGAIDTELPPAAALADNTGNPSAPAVGSFLHGFDGTDWERLRCDGTTKRLEVEVENNPVLGAGANNIGDVDIASFAAGSITEVQGDVAHNTTIAGNPVTIGAEGRSTDRTAVSDGTAARLMCDVLGKMIVLPYAIPERLVDGAVAAAMTGTADTQVVAAPGAGLRNYITQVTITNDHATVGTVVNLKTAVTTRYKVFAAAAGGGASITLPSPIRCGVNEAFNAANVTTGSSVYVSASGFIAL